MRQNVYATNQNVTGVGLLTRASRAHIYAALGVSLVDGRTFEEIEVCWLEDPQQDGTERYMRPRNDLKAESFDAMTQEQNKRSSKA